MNIYYHNIDLHRSYLCENKYINNSNVLYVPNNIKISSNIHFARLATHVTILKNIMNMSFNNNNYFYISETNSVLPIEIKPILKKHNIQMLIMKRIRLLLNLILMKVVLQK